MRSATNSSTSSPTQRRDDLLDAHRHQVVLGLVVGDAVDLRRGLAELLDELGHVGRLVDPSPVEVGLVRRVLGDDEPGRRAAGAGQLGPAEEPVGVGLQGALADRRPVTVVLEEAGDAPGRRRPGWGGDVALLEREHHVVVERLGEALDQHVVRRQPGAADAEARPADDVEHVEGDPRLALGRGQVSQVARRRRRLHLDALGADEPPHSGAVGEPPAKSSTTVAPSSRSTRVHELGRRAARRAPRRDAVSRVSAQSVSSSTSHVVLHVVDVRTQVRLDQVVDHVVGQRLLPAQQREARRRSASGPTSSGRGRPRRSR